MAAATSRRLLGGLASLWGVGGVALLLGSAVWRLTPMALEALRSGAMGALHWFVLTGWLAFMGYSEGYRGFHTRFSPRTAARALHLGQRPTPLRAILAPLFCMGFFAASRRVLVTSWSITTMVVVLVLIVHRIPQPWRGIIDAGVVLGLAWGLASLLWFYSRGVVRREEPTDPEVPPRG